METPVEVDSRDGWSNCRGLKLASNVLVHVIIYYDVLNDETINDMEIDSQLQIEKQQAARTVGEHVGRCRLLLVEQMNLQEVW